MIVVPIQQVRAAAHVLSIPTPTLHYRLNEAAGANNAIEVVSGLDMTQHNSPGSMAGVRNNARTFNGSNQYFDHAVDAAFALATVETIGLWVYLTSLATNQDLLVRAVVSGNVDWHIFYVPSGNKFRIGIRTSGSTLTFFDSPSGPTINQWCCVAVKWDGTNLYWSIDGAAWGTGAAYNTTTTPPLSSGTAKAYIGADVALTGAENWTHGAIELATFWKSVNVSSAEIADFYNSGAAAYFNGTTWVP